ncbi:hypothetical protein BGZ61DRAFT_487247 [Ilyonectria robusta]|uniref:uncharacterized protein n=1 Tax=Ilyonectria robusta TaxID=1079257 RepID=UPI001E8E0C7C|nr:uncharacterized protein BGZ61DRAFT_487247 [Ilyonectria robusta]KAH8653917.1 hypothetical protein BGZ61DRAFT_487247 [Ilyonectria robusta]
MAAFVHSYPQMAGDFAFGQYFDGIASTPAAGCLMTPPPYHISISSPTSQSHMAYQQAMNQVTEGSFFDEAIGTSPISTEIGLVFPKPTPQYVMAAKIPEEYEPSQTALPTVEREKKPPRRPRNRRKSQESSSLSETGASVLVSDVLKPSKQGRKPKVEPKEPVKACWRQKGKSNDDEDLPRDLRRRRNLECNRIAATKCRLRKRDEASALASREQTMEDQNQYLSTCFDQLTAEIYHLKTQLLQHTDCNCVLIQKYIANEARKSVNSLLSLSSAFQLPNGLTPHHGCSSGRRTSGTDSLSIQTPEMESAPPTWTDPFRPDSRSSEVGDDLFDMVLEPFQKEPLPAPSQSISNVPSLSRCDQGVFGSSGPQAQPVVGMVWESQWGFH